MTKTLLIMMDVLLLVRLNQVGNAQMQTKENKLQAVKLNAGMVS
jgi:hypothetical protein